MWIAKIKIKSEKTLIGSKAIKYNIVMYGYPISSNAKKDGIYVHIAGSILGKEQDKKEFIKELRKDKEVLHFEEEADFILGQIKQPLKFKPIFNPEVIYLEPIIIKDDGYEYWTIGSWDKNELIDFIDVLEKYREGKLLSIQQKKATSVSIIKAHPELTKKQRQAIELAIKNGYYSSPRKIDVKELAKISGLSFSTYQVHLRKAEGKIMPFLIK